MHLKTQTQINAAALGTAQLFKSIYDEEFSSDHASEIDFFANHVYFDTLTFNQNKISIHDRLGLGTGRCHYQALIDERTNDPWQLKSKQFSELVAFAERHRLNIQDACKLPHAKLLAAILQQIKEPILHRPIIALRPKPHPLKVFEHLHRKLSRACLGDHIERKIRYQPLAFAYVDFEGTRHGASVDPLQSTWMHVHAAIFVRPQHIPSAEAFFAQLTSHFEYQGYQRKLNSLIEIERQRPLSSDEQKHRLRLQSLLRNRPKLRLDGDLRALYDLKCEHYNAEHPLAELIGYSSKGADQVPVQFVRKDNRMREGVYCGADDLFGIFPRQLSSLDKNVESLGNGE